MKAEMSALKMALKMELEIDLARGMASERAQLTGWDAKRVRLMAPEKVRLTDLDSVKAEMWALKTALKMEREIDLARVMATERVQLTGSGSRKVDQLVPVRARKKVPLKWMELRRALPMVPGTLKAK